MFAAAAVVVLMSRPVRVEARLLRDVDGRTFEYTFVVSDGQKARHFPTLLIDDTRAELDREIRNSVGWMPPYLSIRTEAGGNAWASERRSVYKLVNGKLTFLGDFVDGYNAHLSRAIGRPCFVDWFDKLEENPQGLCHACRPSLQIVACDSASGVSVDIEETWRQNAQFFREAMDGINRCTHDCVAQFTQAAVLAKYCRRDATATRLLARAKRVLSADHFETVVSFVSCVKPGEMSTAWRPRREEH